MNGPDPNYDLEGAFQSSAPGYVLQPEILDSLAAQYVANGYQPLTSGQVMACALTGATEVQEALENSGLLPPNTDPYPEALPPVYPTSLPRIPDSNEEPFDGWVQYGYDLQGADW